MIETIALKSTPQETKQQNYVHKFCKRQIEIMQNKIYIIYDKLTIRAASANYICRF